MLEIHVPKPEEQEIELEVGKKKFGFFLDYPIDKHLPKCEI